MAKSGQNENQALQGGAYEIIRNRLHTHSADLRERLDKLNEARRGVFGSIDLELVGTERVLTANNCTPRDMTSVGDCFLFGYNVQIGLRSETNLNDVFAVYAFREHHFEEMSLAMLDDKRFVSDFHDLYRYYKKTRFVKFANIGPHLYMVFRVGKEVSDVKVFKWLSKDDGTLQYMDNRSDHEFQFPPQHDFEWVRAHRDMQRSGIYPHISISDRIFVETTGGDLTIKVEDNTDTGEGIYQETVEDPDQTLDDAEIFSAEMGNLILLKIKPYNENAYRYIVYSEKVQEARRIDTIEKACVLLPEDHGLIFSNGFFLQTGEFKEFENASKDLLFERRIASPNGEDFLYVFYKRDTGAYALLSYNIIEQKVETPIECQGFCLFQNGELIYFTAQEEASKSHVIQIWQTPYTEDVEAVVEQKDSLLYKIGNRDIVRCMAGCHTLLGLLYREDSYANLYVDISKLSNDLLDSYFWIQDQETFSLGEPLHEIKSAASSAIDEFEKVLQLKHAATDQLKQATAQTDQLLNDTRLLRHDNINDHVKTLASLQALRGQVISLREIRYMDAIRVKELEDIVQQQHNQMAKRCVQFLLRDDAMAPYIKRIEELDAQIENLGKVSEGEALRKEVEGISTELEMLIEIVSNLNIEDTTQRTEIIDRISSLFSGLNQGRAALTNKIKQMAVVEGEAEFASQMKLLGQAVVNYLDVCDDPEKCESYLSKIMIQVEELEGRFSDFDEYVNKLAEKREEIYNAFESRRLSLLEGRNKKANALMRSATRIIKSISSRVENMDSIEAINGYFASDLMVEKTRDIVEQLLALDDPVKADDIRTQLKSAREDAIRQLHDRSELFVKGKNVIQFGRHHFSVNNQSLDLTIVPRDSQMALHLTGTSFFEAIENNNFLETKDVWAQELISENQEVYRAEYLAYLLFPSPPEEVLSFMTPRYAEGYQKGVHDEDASKILQALLEIHEQVGLLRYHSCARALAIVFQKAVDFSDLAARIRGVGESNRVFQKNKRQEVLIDALHKQVHAFAESTSFFDLRFARQAAEYLFDIISGNQENPISSEAAEICKGFNTSIKRLAVEKSLMESRLRVASDAFAEYHLVHEWIGAFIADGKTNPDYQKEAAALIFADLFSPARILQVSINREIPGLRGSHPRVSEGKYTLNYNEFFLRLETFVKNVVPRYEEFQALKKKLIEQARQEMHLESFKPRVLTSFVRNRLIDKVYLPLVGDNLAKQIGVANNNTRTDRMGMLMLISPPGYGKTTLMEYVANRLGLVFMKINGPAIGHRVTSLDPLEAPNATAREELNKLGLALEMGDNVMLYVDDIQHCNPEFLQKFISLCDAQRKIEGVYKDQTKTYDFRGKKVAVVMAGNPYTESGDKFRIPDMLANRADTYNLGDILGDNVESFDLSFLENALTSNPVLNKLASSSRNDIHTVIHLAETGSREGMEFEGNYSAQEMEEMLSVLKKLIRIREVVLRVNHEYIRSANQADEYRTEPAFKLQGSYRNMNRMTEKVQPIMNDRELETLIYSEYESEAQTLTTDAEANLLKFKELLNCQTEEEVARWAEIKKTYARHQLMRGGDENNPASQAVAQLAQLGEGMHDIRDILQESVKTKNTQTEGKEVVTDFSKETLSHLTELFNSLKHKTAKTETYLAPETLKQIFSLIEKMKPELIPIPTESFLSDSLRSRCQAWLHDFLIPLRNQNSGATLKEPIYTTDLENIIKEIKALIG